MSVEVLSILVLCTVVSPRYRVSDPHGSARNRGGVPCSACSCCRAISTRRPTRIAGGFPGDLFVVLAGVTSLFAMAKNNGPSCFQESHQ